MSYDYSENILVQESAGNLLRDELGWDVRFAYNMEVLGEGGTFGRRSYREILLVRYLRAALKRLNPNQSSCENPNIVIVVKRMMNVVFLIVGNFRQR